MLFIIVSGGMCLENVTTDNHVWH